MKQNLIQNTSAITSENEYDDTVDELQQFFVEPDAKPEPPKLPEPVIENLDIVDQTFTQMGGFGKLQKFSYLMNTLA
jgi:hypothetical protein